MLCELRGDRRILRTSAAKGGVVQAPSTGMPLALVLSQSHQGKECQVREHIRELIASARRATRTEPADQRFEESIWDRQRHFVDGGSFLAAHAVRLAQIAAAVHMAEAASRIGEFDSAQPHAAEVAS